MDTISETQDPAQVEKAAQALSEIHNADLIIEGQGPTYAVCEISINVERHDVERALARAEALQWLSGAATRPVVVGAVIPDEERRRAEANGAKPFTLPDR